MKSLLNKFLRLALITVTVCLVNCKATVSGDSSNSGASQNKNISARYVAKVSSLTAEKSFMTINFYDDLTFTVFQSGHTENRESGLHSIIDEEFLVKSGTYTGNSVLQSGTISLKTTKEISQESFFTDYITFSSNLENFTVTGNKAYLKISSSAFSYTDVSKEEKFVVYNESSDFMDCTFESIKKTINITGYNVTSDGTSLTLKWPELKNAEKYTVYFSETGNGNSKEELDSINWDSLSGSSSTVTYTLPSDRLERGKTYYFWVRAEFVSGDLSAFDYPYSLSYTTVPAPQLSLFTDGFNISTVPGATSYKIYRNTVEDVSSAVHITTVNSSGHFVDNTLHQTGSYYYWVKAVKGSEESDFSRYLKFDFVVIKISAPKIGRVHYDPTKGIFNLNLEAPETGTAVRYDLYVSSDPKENYTKLTSSENLLIEFSIEDSDVFKTSGEKYFKAKAVNAENEESSFSNDMIINYTYYPLLMPEIISATLSDSNVITLNWKPVKDAACYKVYYYREIVFDAKIFPDESDYVEIPEPVYSTSFIIPEDVILPDNNYYYEFTVKAFTTSDEASQMSVSSKGILIHR